MILWDLGPRLNHWKNTQLRENRLNMDWETLLSPMEPVLLETSLSKTGSWLCLNRTWQKQTAVCQSVLLPGWLSVGRWRPWWKPWHRMLIRPFCRRRNWQRFHWSLCARTWFSMGLHGVSVGFNYIVDCRHCTSMLVDYAVCQAHLQFTLKTITMY